MEEIFDTNANFDFSKMVLTKPTVLSGGNYFMRILMKNQYLYIQPPKCKTKQGIQKNGKRFYTDLVFTNENENFIQWIENLEKQCQATIFKNRQQWFDGEMELHDIEDYFTPILKVYKSGKLYSIRINVTANISSNKPALKIYDEDENDIEFDTIDDKMDVMTILEVKGIKFSAKSFQIDIELKQMMVTKPKNLFEKYLLKPKSENIEKQMEEPLDTRAAMPPLPDTISPPLVEMSNIQITDSSSLEKQEPLENITFEIEKGEPEIESKKTDENKIVDGMEEIEFNLDEIQKNEPVQLKQRNEVYYQMYKEARKKAKIARDFALSAYLEAKEIKNKYMLDDLKDSDDSDLDIDIDIEIDENAELE
jgi:hypothetical protein